ncbi:hypothetical protein FRX31_019283 [Thalictrum thalictroides]|uniref:Uncharacterized protein n=1 Tax=Thalictrum thalictroides TaxID=46969 RepID=A0A7J6W147_THATH|nr:hypothetical protein FRX31_019283 [Thalictrum thalictroides]
MDEMEIRRNKQHQQQENQEDVDDNQISRHDEQLDRHPTIHRQNSVHRKREVTGGDNRDEILVDDQGREDGGLLYARLMRMVTSLKEEVRAQVKGKNKVVTMDLEKLGKRPLAKACYQYAFPSKFHPPKFH